MWIKQCTQEDLGWLINFGIECYGEKFKNHEKTRSWLSVRLNDPNSLVLRSDNAAIVVLRNSRIFDGKIITYVYLWAGNIWQICGLFREAKKWCKMNGGEKLGFGCDTGYNVIPLAQRIGGKILENQLFMGI